MLSFSSHFLIKKLKHERQDQALCVKFVGIGSAQKDFQTLDWLGLGLYSTLDIKFELDSGLAWSVAGAVLKTPL